MHNKQFILHLTLIEDIGPAIIQPIIRSDMQISDLYSFSPTDWVNTFGFSENTAEKLVTGLASTKLLEEELVLIEQHNIQWLTFEDEAYPQLLKHAYLPPAVIYYLGAPVFNPSIHSATLKTSQNTQGERINLSPAHTDPSIHHFRDTQGERMYRSKKLLAIVGARKADQYGYNVINQLVPELVAAQYTIVSGGALGIDAAAHEATVKSGGKTIAVLGSGLLQLYPSANKKLFASIVERGGCLVSSFPLRMQALPGHFPARNRIISGLSHGCLVVQAAQKSGALITAHYALEQGREVFAIPGSIDSELSVGCNTLIQSGAKLVMNSADILNEFGDRVIIDNRVIQEKVKQLSLESFQCARPEPVEGYPRALQDTLQQVQGERERTNRSGKIRDSYGNKYSHYSNAQKQIIIACKQPLSFDDVVINTQLTSNIVQAELFNLQLDGVLEQDFTGMWQVQQV